MEGKWSRAPDMLVLLLRCGRARWRTVTRWTSADAETRGDRGAREVRRWRPGAGFGLTELQAGDGVSTSVMAASRLGTMGSNRWAANAPVAPRPQGRAARPDHQRTAGAGGASTGRRVSGSGQRLPVMAIGGTGIGFRGGDSPRAVAAAGAGGGEGGTARLPRRSSHLRTC